MFIKSKLLAWSAKSRKTPGMECKVQINSISIFVGWNNSLLNSMPGVSAFI
jgi:hypothetical protein